jgi:hypothetical protein
MSYSTGSLVRARGREWVVLPDSTDDLLVLRPLGGAEEEVAGAEEAVGFGDSGEAGGWTGAEGWVFVFCRRCGIILA